jgi:hypothetical protein
MTLSESKEVCSFDMRYSYAAVFVFPAVHLLLEYDCCPMDRHERRKSLVCPQKQNEISG